MSTFVIYLLVVVFLRGTVKVQDVIIGFMLGVITIMFPGLTIAAFVLSMIISFIAGLSAIALMQLTFPKFFNYVLWSWNKKVKE